MTPRWTEWQTASTVGKEHHREERRTLESTTTLNLYLADRLGWSSVRQVFRVTRDVAQINRVTGEKQKSREVVYGITSLSRNQADAQKLLELISWSLDDRERRILRPRRSLRRGPLSGEKTRRPANPGRLPQRRPEPAAPRG